MNDNNSRYWKNITEIQKKQTAKGIKKYGDVLENNTTMDIIKRIEMMQEEMVDMLQYAEHIKTYLKEKGSSDYLVENLF